mmetsp:Transcript_4249/g.8279  ORF Transcript_4249/g.8279 Transcript_4249/m.8279 type:complete len:92 (+) Transcript_4249:1049-1324(+)
MGICSSNVSTKEIFYPVWPEIFSGASFPSAGAVNPDRRCADTQRHWYIRISRKGRSLGSDQFHDTFNVRCVWKHIDRLDRFNSIIPDEFEE